MTDYLLSPILFLLKVLFYTWPVIVAGIVWIIWQKRGQKPKVQEVPHVLLSIKAPKNNEKGPAAAEMMFNALHGIIRPKREMIKQKTPQEYVSFEIVADHETIQFFVWVPESLKSFVESQIYAQYPTAEIKEVSDYSLNVDINGNGIEDYIIGTELMLTKSDFYPIRTFLNFEVDPLASITSTLSKIEEPHEKIWAQILIRPASKNFSEEALSYVQSVRSGTKLITKKEILKFLLLFPFKLIQEIGKRIIAPTEFTPPVPPQLATHEEAALKAIEEKAAELVFETKMRIVYLSKDPEKGKERLLSTIAAFRQFNTATLNGFTHKNLFSDKKFLNLYQNRDFQEKGFILNIRELASLYHLPYVSVEAPGIVWTASKKAEPPANLPFEGTLSEKELTLFGKIDFRGMEKKFGLKKDDRRRHVYIIGKSGTGKSKLLELLAVSDIKQGKGVALIDPHGETAEAVLKHVPEDRLNDIVYFNPADKDFPIALNALELPDPEFKETIASGFIAIFKKLWEWTWGPRLEYVLRHTVLALLDYPNSTMLGVVRMLTDKEFRKKVIQKIKDPVVKSFWVNEFAAYNDRFAIEAVAPILNKVGQFVASPIIRNIVGQPKSTINLREVMDQQKILIVNLSTGKIGEDNATLLGSLMITKIQLAAMSRADIPEEQRKDFYLYVDEFQNFATESFARILSEARKYRLNLTVANQYIAQMDETVREAIFGNIGTLIAFRVGARDGEFLQKEFQPIFEANDLVNLDLRYIYVKMGINGITSNAFSAQTLEVPTPTLDQTEKIIQLSRERYARPREVVEEKIVRWSQGGEEGSQEEKLKTEPPRQQTPKYPENTSILSQKQEDKPREPERSQGAQKAVKTPQNKVQMNQEALKKVIQEATAKKSTPSSEDVSSKEAQTNQSFPSVKGQENNLEPQNDLQEIKPGETITFK